MASDFILQIICRIHQIRNPKRPLFRVKSQKNDIIGFATLIAPKITSGIKPEMYGSLFSAHMAHYCLENYCVFDCTRESLHEYCHECIRECVHCRVTGSPSVSPFVAIKRWGRGLCQKHQSVAAMAYPWCSCSRPPKACVVLSSKRC